MTANNQPTLREQVEDFLFREAALLDDWRLDEWVDLFTQDARYIVPTTDLPDGDPKRDLVFIDDDITRLRARAVRLNSRHAHREYPWSRTRRFVSNVRVEETDNGETLGRLKRPGLPVPRRRGRALRRQHRLHSATGWRRT